MKTYKNKMGLLLISLLISIFFVGCSNQNSSTKENNDEKKEGNNNVSEEEKIITFGSSAGPGSSSYIIYSGMADLINEYVPNVRAKVTVTSGSAENARLLASGQIDIGVVNSKDLYDAYHAQDVYKDVIEPEKIQFLMSGIVTADQLITLDPKIKNFSDLKGKNIAIPTPGSAGATWIWDGWIKAHNLSKEDFKESPMTYGEMADALKDGHVDAAFITTTIPTSFLEDLSVREDIYFLELTPDTQTLIADDLLKGYYVKNTIPQDTYSFLDRDIATVGLPIALAANSDLDAETVYQITKVLYEKNPELIKIHPAAKDWPGEGERAVLARVVPGHEGADRYWKEIGFVE